MSGPSSLRTPLARVRNLGSSHSGTRDFWRLRLGIGHPGDRAEVVNFVLNDPRKEERALIEQAVQRALEISDLIITGKQEAAMLKLHSA